MTYFGEGASNQGQVYESFNMAELWKLPVIYVIENNKYAMGTALSGLGHDRPVAARASVQHSGRAGRRHGCSRGYGSLRKGAGMVPLGKGPYILEMKTYRYRGHSMSDPAKYRTKDEVQKMREEHDPIEQVKRLLSTIKWAVKTIIKALDKDIASTCHRGCRICTERSGAGRV
jgi:pyruvate dehydrogenase E1 component alpha subunit